MLYGSALQCVKDLASIAPDPVERCMWYEPGLIRDTDRVFAHDAPDFFCTFGHAICCTALDRRNAWSRLGINTSAHQQWQL